MIQIKYHLFKDGSVIWQGAKNTTEAKKIIKGLEELGYKPRIDHKFSKER